ncbi:IS256 family transposase [Orenia marismortui]|uniref:IS256 family transposase n=1 Tax=Orenia marismortui TaxID=46469 RepID=UPI00038024CF|nr:IS256 family transposase [Orenia marismortui]
MNSIIENLLSGQENLDNNLDSLLLNLIKNFLELLLQSEITEFLGYQKYNTKGNNSGNSRNGSYNRGLHTKYGKIENLNIPRDRNGEFNTALFQPHQTRDQLLEEMIVMMYARGLSTRDIADVIEKMYGHHYSPSTISNITDIAIEEIEKWRNRKLKERYSVIFIDGTSVKVRRDHVDNESIYVIIGIDEEGYREILDFYIAPTESASVWEEQLSKLKSRGVQQVLLGVIDGLPGLRDAFLKVFPKADIQRCVVHKLRNTASKVRKKHLEDIMDDLKPIYKALTLEQAEKALNEFIAKWQSIYPEVTDSWLDDKYDLLAFYKYPESIRKSIYTTNWIERTNKEIKKRLKPTNSLPNITAAEKLVYLTVINYNDRWSQRRMKGFLQAKDDIIQLFKERYQ